MSRVETANSAARVEPRKKGYFNAAQIYAYSRGCAVPDLRCSGTNHRYRARGRRTTHGIGSGRRRRHRSLGGRRYREWQRRYPPRPYSGEAHARLDRNQSCRQHRSAYLSDRATRPRKALYAVRRLVLSGGAVGQGAVRALDAGAARSGTATVSAMPLRVISPPWRPLTAYDDGRKVYIEFPQGIVQGEMLPLFVIGHDGKTEIVNYRAYGNVLDRRPALCCRGVAARGRAPAESPDCPDRREVVVMSTLQSDDSNEQPGEPNRSEELAHGFRLRADHPRVTRLSRKVLAGGVLLRWSLLGVPCFGPSKTTAPAGQRRTNSTAPIITTSLMASPDCHGTMLAFRVRCPRWARRFLVILAGQSSPRRDSRQPPPRRASIRSSSAATRRPKPHVSAACSPPPIFVRRRPLQPRLQRWTERPPSSMPGTDDGFAQNGQDRKLAFVNASVDRRSTSPDRVTRPASPYVVQAGTVIPGHSSPASAQICPGRSRRR